MTEAVEPRTITLTLPDTGWGSTGDNTSIAYDVQRAIEYALRYNHPVGLHLESRTVHDMADAVCQALGIPTFGNGGIPRDRLRVVDTDHQTEKAMIRETVRQLLEWAPESGYPDELWEVGEKYDNVGFDYGNPVTRLDYGDAAYLSEAVSYAALGGKHDGRTLKAYIQKVREAVGLEVED